MQRIIQQTADGSLTIAVTNMNVTYHSIHGAVQESLHVFINAALQPLLNTKPKLNILEVGFGTGLNALLTLNIILQQQHKVYYEAIELYPLENSIYEKLNYANALSNTNLHTAFLKMHSSKWNEDVTINNLFQLHKANLSLQEYSTAQTFDIVYFDAFDPSVQPELWTQEIFKKMFAIMNAKSILTTYSAKGSVRRNMLAAGFKVEKLKGPPGKREIIRAIKL